MPGLKPGMRGLVGATETDAHAGDVPCWRGAGTPYPIGALIEAISD
jgi:hypothetical protein